MANGWVKLHRQMTEWGWYKDNNTKCLFIHLLLMANHEKKEYKGVVIKKGQLMTGLELLSSQTGMSVMEIRTALKHLKLTNEITINSTNKGTIITILNWCKYQLNEELITSNSTQEQQTDNKQITTNKNDKKIKEDDISNNVITQKWLEAGYSPSDIKKAYSLITNTINEHTFAKAIDIVMNNNIANKQAYFNKSIKKEGKQYD